MGGGVGGGELDRGGGTLEGCGGGELDRGDGTLGGCGGGEFRKGGGALGGSGGGDSSGGEAEGGTGGGEFGDGEADDITLTSLYQSTSFHPQGIQSNNHNNKDRLNNSVFITFMANLNT